MISNNSDTVNKTNYLLIFLILFGFFCSEFFLVFVDLNLGLIFYMLLLFALILLSSLFYGKAINARTIDLDCGCRVKELSYLFLSLTPVPLMRILNFVLPFKIFDETLQLFVIGLSLSFGVFFVLKHLELSVKDAGFAFPKERYGLIFQLLVVLTGISFGFMEYLILKPQSSMIPSFSLGLIVISGLVVILVSGFLEELIFRGIIQRSSEKVFGNLWGLLFSTLIFTIMHIHLKSFKILVFVFFIGLFYGIIYQKTKNILGISLSHGIGNVILLIIAPLIF